MCVCILDVEYVLFSFSCFQVFFFQKKVCFPGVKELVLHRLRALGCHQHLPDGLFGAERRLGLLGQVCWKAPLRGHRALRKEQRVCRESKAKMGG